MTDKETLYYKPSEQFTLKRMDKLPCDIVPTSYFYSVILKDSGLHIGHIYLGSRKPHNFKEYNIEYILNKKYQNRGYCSEVVKALIDYDFNHFEIH